MNFDILYRELQNSTEMIRTLLAGLTQEEVQSKPDNKSWSILEVVCHLYDEEREDFREHLDSILYRTNEEWAPFNPQGWVTERKYNEQDFAVMREKFFAEREISLEWLKGLTGADWDTTHTSSFGSMKAGDMFASWVAHDNLHIRQLAELRRARIENITRPYWIEYAGDW
ncbi:MAG TPA: DinB family protein [Anaerolineales bacterium]|nr:DinB family protein [Anaerolineales bacterium]